GGENFSCLHSVAGHLDRDSCPTRRSSDLGINHGDGLVAGGEVAAVIGGLPRAGDDASVAGARRKSVGVADGHVAAGVAAGGGTLDGRSGGLSSIHGGVWQAGDCWLGGVQY